jgi:single-strand DNA-binding protein
MNSINLVGRITKDLELKYTPSGAANVNFTIAVNRSFTNQQGEREADFIQCIAWRAQAENLCNFQGKGSLISVSGRIQTRNYEGQDGRRVYVTEVVAENIGFLEKRNGGQDQNGSKSEIGAAGQGETIDISDDDLPF